MVDCKEIEVEGYKMFFDFITHKYYVWVNGKKKTSYCKENLIKYLK